VNGDRRISDRVVDAVGSDPLGGRERAVTSRMHSRRFESTLVAVFLLGLVDDSGSLTIRYVIKTPE
jgi:hypothetical protein